jgi:hypothetical protein
VQAAKTLVVAESRAVLCMAMRPLATPGPPKPGGFREPEKPHGMTPLRGFAAAWAGKTSALQRFVRWRLIG